MFCEKCGAENPDDATFCGSCGHKFEKIKAKEINMTLALVISFLLPGLGITYVGNAKKGVIIFAVCLMLSIFGLGFGIFSVFSRLIWAYGLYLTYNEVRMANGESNPNIIEDWKTWDLPKKAVSVVVVIVIILMIIASVIFAFMPKTYYDDFDEYKSSSSSVDLSDSDSYQPSSSSGGNSYSSSSNGHDVSSHYEGDSGSADTYGTVYDDGSVESHQTGHTDYGDYKIDSYMDSDGNMHGTVDMGGQTYHVSV